MKKKISEKTKRTILIITDVLLILTFGYDVIMYFITGKLTVKPIVTIVLILIVIIEAIKDIIDILFYE